MRDPIVRPWIAILLLLLWQNEGMKTVAIAEAKLTRQLPFRERTQTHSSAQQQQVGNGDVLRERQQHEARRLRRRRNTPNDPYSGEGKNAVVRETTLRQSTQKKQASSLAGEQSGSPQFILYPDLSDNKRRQKVGRRHLKLNPTLPSQKHSAPNITKHIIGGVQGVPGAHPFYASVAQGAASLCGASLIAPDILVTAGHCLYAWDSGAVVGAYLLGSIGEIGGVRSVEVKIVDEVIHPNYVDEKFDGTFDLMLLKIDPPVEHIDPIKVNFTPNFPADGASLQIMGFGLTELNDISYTLLEAEIFKVNDDECESYYGIDSKILICAYATGDNLRKTCQGDSGGPLVDNDSGTLVGVLSFGPNECLDVLPSGFTRLSAYKDWMETEICALSDYSPAAFGCGGDGSGEVTETEAPTSPPPTPAATTDPCAEQEKAYYDCLDNELQEAEEIQCVECVNAAWSKNQDTCADTASVACMYPLACGCLQCAEKVSTYLACRAPVDCGIACTGQPTRAPISPPPASQPTVAPTPGQASALQPSPEPSMSPSLAPSAASSTDAPSLPPTVKTGEPSSTRTPTSIPTILLGGIPTSTPTTATVKPVRDPLTTEPTTTVAPSPAPTISPTEYVRHLTAPPSSSTSPPTESQDCAFHTRAFQMCMMELNGDENPLDQSDDSPAQVCMDCVRGKLPQYPTECEHFQAMICGADQCDQCSPCGDVIRNYLACLTSCPDDCTGREIGEVADNAPIPEEQREAEPGAVFWAPHAVEESDQGIACDVVQVATETCLDVTLTPFAKSQCMDCIDSNWPHADVPCSSSDYDELLCVLPDTCVCGPKCTKEVSALLQCKSGCSRDCLAAGATEPADTAHAAQDELAVASEIDDVIVLPSVSPRLAPTLQCNVEKEAYKDCLHTEFAEDSSGQMQQCMQCIQDLIPSSTGSSCEILQPLVCHNCTHCGSCGSLIQEYLECTTGCQDDCTGDTLPDGEYQLANVTDRNSTADNSVSGTDDRIINTTALPSLSFTSATVPPTSGFSPTFAPSPGPTSSTNVDGRCDEHRSKIQTCLDSELTTAASQQCQQCLDKDSMSGVFLGKPDDGFVPVGCDDLRDSVCNWLSDDCSCGTCAALIANASECILETSERGLERHLATPMGLSSCPPPECSDALLEDTADVDNGGGAPETSRISSGTVLPTTTPMLILLASLVCWIS